MIRRREGGRRLETSETRVAIGGVVTFAVNGEGSGP